MYLNLLRLPSRLSRLPQPPRLRRQVRLRPPRVVSSCRRRVRDQSTQHPLLLRAPHSAAGPFLSAHVPGAGELQAASVLVVVQVPLVVLAWLPAGAVLCTRHAATRQGRAALEVRVEPLDVPVLLPAHRVLVSVLAPALARDPEPLAQPASCPAPAKIPAGCVLPRGLDNAEADSATKR